MNLDQQNERIKVLITKMQNTILQMYQQLGEVMETKDNEKILKIINADTYVNNYQSETVDQITNALALLSPVAKDLRLMVSLLQVIIDMERMGDYAKKIGEVLLVDAIKSKTIIRFCQELIQEIMEDFQKSIESFWNEDDSFAFEIKEKDYSTKFQQLFHLIDDRETGNFESMYYFFILFKSLERTKDHVINICESTLYYIRGTIYDLG